MSEYETGVNGTERNEYTDVSNITKKEYIEKYASPFLRNDIKKAAVAGYICSGISAVIWIVLGNPMAIFEILVAVGLLLGMHLGKSKACAIIYLCMACLDCLVGLIATGRPTGWIIIATGIYAVKTFVTIDKQYAEFKRTGIL
ncbi:MAG: hypothetical protein J1F64_09870 [Oscillospiraceae bacterium]|nr:hypothetical protein [Oscillospiraceae bacterium]